AQLDRLEELLARRRAVAERYQRALAGHSFFIPPHVPAELTPNLQSYQIPLRPGVPLARNTVIERLPSIGFPTPRGVVPSHREPPYRDMGAVLPNSERLAATTLQLPMHPALTLAQQDRVVAALDAIFSKA